MSQNFHRRTRRKTQTKLTFDPVPKEEDSSPSAKMSPARVRSQLPTPAQSSQTMGRDKLTLGGLDGADDDDDLVFSQARTRSSPYKAESDSDEDLLALLRKKKKPVKAPGAFKSLSDKSKKQKQKNLSLSDSEDDDDQDEDKDKLATVTPVKKRHTRFKIEDSDDSEDKDLQASGPRRERATLAVPDEEDDEDKSPIHMSARRRPRPALVLPNDEDDDALRLPKPRQPGMNAGLSKKFIELSDDDDDIPVSSPSKRRRSLALTDNWGDDEPMVSSPPKRMKIDSDSDIAISPTKRPRRDLTDEDDEMEDVNESDSDVPRSRAAARGTRTAITKSPATSTRYTRQAKPPKKHRTAKQKAAELLRRKRAGEKIDEVTESSSDDESDAGLYDSDQELQSLAFFEDEEPSPESTEVVAPAPAPAPALRRRVGNNDASDDEDDDEDDAFVIDDGDQPLGVPDMPLQFSRRAHKPLKDNFADCVEWLVHSKIDPEFPGRNEEQYSHAFNKVDDEAHGYAISSFISSQWTSEFTAAIKNRPFLTTRDVEDGEGITADGEVKCDACNHRKHPPKYALSFRGEPYKRKTLEEVEQDSDYEAGDEDAIAVDEAGNDLEPAGREWFSGRDCSDKAFQAHKLIHWRYSLNQAVIETLEEDGHLTDRKIAKRERSTADERWEYADKIVQDWKTKGIIAELYREFKKMMETARAYEPRRYGR